MKRIYLALAVSVISTSLYAQPVLQNGVELQKGIQIPFSVGAVASPGMAGSNVTWDFSNLAVSSGGTFERVEPVTTPYYSKFSACDYVLKINSSVTFYNYYNLNATKFEWVGFRWGNGMPSINFAPDPLLFMNFPLKYNDKVIDHVKSDTVYEYDDTVFCDGYGTLKTPYGTYPNTLRIKYTDDGGNSIYEWYVTDPAYFTYAMVRIDGGSTRILNYKPTSIGEIRKTEVKVYPNPAKGHFTVEGAAGSTIRVTDHTGRLLLSTDIATQRQVIQTNGLAAGSYLYAIAHEGNTVKGGVLVVE